MDEAEKQPLLSCTLTIESSSEKREHIGAVLWDDKLCFDGPGWHREIRLSLLSSLHAKNYRIWISTSNEEMVLSMMGHIYEDFARRFVSAYNEVLLNESLMKEPIHFETEGYYTAPEGDATRSVLRICETAITVIPETHNLLRIPFCMIAQTDVQPYRFSITDRRGRTHVLSKLGFSTDAFIHAYQERMAELIRCTKEKLCEIAPADDRLAQLLMEGLVQPLTDIRAVSARFADTLNDALAASSIRSEYAYLCSISEELAIGVKRGLMGDLTGESILLLAPVFDKNVFVMESLGDATAATYVFRLSASGLADKNAWRRILPDFNESMLSVNFRREPIYLSDEALREARYEPYANALRRVPSLVRLRALYLGRAVHSGFDTWRNKIESLMQ